jgi:hypothetical protein
MSATGTSYSSTGTGFHPRKPSDGPTPLAMCGLDEFSRIEPAWRDHGFSAREAEGWMGWFGIWHPDQDILTFRNAGYTPEQAARLQHATDGPHRWVAWAEAPVPGEYAWRYALAGISPTEATHWENRRLEGHDVLPNLRLLAALRTFPGTRLPW